MVNTFVDQVVDQVAVNKSFTVGFIDPLFMGFYECLVNVWSTNAGRADTWTDLE